MEHPSLFLFSTSSSFFITWITTASATAWSAVPAIWKEYKNIVADWEQLTKLDYWSAITAARLAE